MRDHAAFFFFLLSFFLPYYWLGMVCKFLVQHFVFPNRNKTLAKSPDLCYNMSVKFKFGRYVMTVNYNKLWKKLIDLEMSRTQMRLKAGISTKQLAKLGKNENVNTEILVKICEALGCNIDEIMDVVEQKEENA